MKRKRLDLTGRRFGRLVALEVMIINKTTRWLCICDCGVTRIVWRCSLTNGTSKSCGCLAKELSSLRNSTHGMSGSRELSVWRDMMHRCKDLKNKDYGGRGIAVCDRWMKFENFFEDMGSRPKGTQIDRIDNDGNYEPSNCKWSTPKENSNNKRDNWLYTFNGETKTLAQWGRPLGLSRRLISGRLNNGWPFKKAITEPVKIRN